MLLLTIALAALPHVTTATHVYAQAVAMGVAGGFVTVVFFSFWGRAYGRTHLGAIQGVAQALTVFASATGPLFFAWCVEATGSYRTAFYVIAAVMAALAAAALLVKVPATVDATGS
jgi:MFS family permease